MPLHPGNVDAKAETDDQLHPEFYAATDAVHQADHIGGLAARRHEVDQRNLAAFRLELGFQDQRVIPVAARGSFDFVRGCDQPAAVARGAQECSEAGVGAKGRPAQPIDRAVTADERCGLTISDQRVVLYRKGHIRYSPSRQVATRIRSCVALLSASTSTADAISSSATGRR